MAGRERNTIEAGVAAKNIAVGDEGPLLLNRTPAEDAALRLSVEACLLASKNSGMTPDYRYRWAESIAKDFHDELKDGSLTGDVGKELQKQGVKIESKPYTPDYKWNGWDKEKLNKTTVTFETACKADSLSKLTVELTPVNNGLDVSFKTKEQVKGADGKLKLADQSITVNMHENRPVSTTAELPDGTIQKIDLDRDRKIQSRQIVNNGKGYSQFTQYERGAERGKEIPKYEETRPGNGTTEIKHFNAGLPTEKLTVNKDRRLIGYNAYDEKGNELSSFNWKSVQGRMYYESREIAGRLQSGFNDAVLTYEVWRLRHQM